MRKITLFILFIINSCAIAQDYTGLYKIALSKYISYYDSTKNQKHCNYFLAPYLKEKYMPSQVGNYTVINYYFDKKKFIKALKKLYKKPETKYETIDLLNITRIYHHDNNDITIVLNENYTFYDSKTKGWDIGTRSFLQVKFKFKCDSNKFIFSGLHDFQKTGVADYLENYTKVFPYKQNGHTLYENSLNIFVDSLRNNNALKDSLVVFTGGGIYSSEERSRFYFDNAFPQRLNNTKIIKLYIRDRDSLARNTLPITYVKQNIYESDGVLTYNYQYITMTVGKDKYMVETPLYEAGFYYKYNCLGRVYDLIKSDFVKIK